MARTVTVTLKAFTGQFRKEIGDAEKAAGKLGDAIDDIDGKTFDEAGARARKLGESIGGTARKSSRDLDEMAAHTRRLDDQIKGTSVSIRDLAKAFATTGDTKVLAQIREQQKVLGELRSVRNLLPDPSALKAGLSANIRTALQSASPQALGAVALGAALAPTVGSMVAAAVVGGAGLGGVAGGMALAARDPRVKAAGQQLGLTLLTDLENRAAGFVTPMIAGIRRVRTEWGTIGADLDTIFASSRFIDPLVDGFTSGGKSFIAGLADAVENADPVMDALASTIADVGGAVGGLFTTMAADADEGASAVYDLNNALVNLIDTTGGVVHGFATVKGGLDDFDVQIDKWRYYAEDNWWLGDLTDGLDLTADGFKRGSKEALAYKAMVTAVGTAADVLTLRAAGMTDAQIRSIDATGDAVNAANEQAEKERLRAAAIDGTAGSLDGLVATEGRAKEAQAELTEAQNDYKRSLDQLSPSLFRAQQISEGLRQASQNLYGAAIAGTEANEAYQASWDNLSKSVKDNKGSLDIHTAAGRENRDALQDLLIKSQDLYLADIAGGEATDTAAKKHRDRTDAVKEEAKRLGLNKKITGELIATYGQIPPKKTTDLVVEGVNRVAEQLYKLTVIQYALAKGVPVATADALLSGRNKPGPDKPVGGYASGGLFDGMLPGSPSNVDNLIGYGPDRQAFGLAGGEYVVNARQTQKHRPLLEAINAGADGYADGGYFPATNTATRLPFEVTADRAYVMSASQARANVVPEGPSGGGATAPWIVNVIKSNFPGVDIVSTFRKGAKTLSGNTSYHASNRAVDTEPSEALARFFYTNYKAKLKELITPWQQYNVHNGASHKYTGAVWNQHNFAGGNAHDHIAMAGGGVIGEPVFGVGASGRTYSFGEVGPERVTPMRGYAGGGLVNVAPSTSTTSMGGGSRLDYLDSLLSARDAVAALTRSLKENGRAWSFSTQKGRDNRQALISGIRAAQQAAEAKFAETGSIKAANRVYDDYIRQLDRSMKAMGVNAKTRKALLKVYGERPKFETTSAAPSNSSSRVQSVTDVIAAEEALSSARQAFAWTKPTFSTKTATGRAELTQLFSFLGAAEAAAQSQYAQTGNAKSATALYNTYVAQLRGILSASGMKKSDIDKLLKDYGRITLARNAAGGIYERASGGLREAQIAAGGPTRYAWAEPETGGEAFIPRNGNRARSMAIWQHVGQQWLGQPIGGGRSGPITIQATIPITLGADTITRQVRLEVDAGIARVVDAVVYQTT